MGYGLKIATLNVRGINLKEEEFDDLAVLTTLRSWLKLQHVADGRIAFR